MDGNRKILPEDMLIVPKLDSDLTLAVKNSSVLKNKIRENKHKIF